MKIVSWGKDHFLNRSIICDFKRRIYHKLQYRFFDTSHISLFHKAFSFFYLLDFFRSTFCPVALLISFIKYFLGSGYIKIRLLYCAVKILKNPSIASSTFFCLCDGPSVKNLMSQKVTTLFVSAVRNAVQIYSI